MWSGGVFTNLAHLGWNPRDGQMKKQGNWWLQGLVHYDYQGEVLLLHRVTGEVHVPAGHAPRVRRGMCCAVWVGCFGLG
jgi:hypothetical protein